MLRPALKGPFQLLLLCVHFYFNPEAATGCVQGPDSSRSGNAEGMTTSQAIA